MICTPDRQAMLSLIDEAHCAGARTVKACAELGIAHRTDQRWQRQADGGPTLAPPGCMNALRMR